MSQRAYWKVKLYDRQDSSSPLVEFIESQSKRDQAKILAELDDLAEFGLMPRGNKLKHIEGKLWELRSGHLFICRQPTTSVGGNSFSWTI